MEAAFLYTLCDTVVRKNRPHLQSHPFYDGINISLSHPGFMYATDFSVETPALTTLEADGCQLARWYESIGNFSNYLKGRPQMKQLDISCSFSDPMNNAVPSDLISSVAHHKSSLKKLKFWIKLENLSDWAFLRESSLQDLRLEDYKFENVEQNEWIRQVMSNLPNSIEKLYLRGASLKGGQKKMQKFPTEPLKIE